MEGKVKAERIISKSYLYLSLSDSDRLRKDVRFDFGAKIAKHVPLWPPDASYFTPVGGGPTGHRCSGDTMVAHALT